MTRPAGSRIDHYELIAHLADGAEAEVHRGRDVHHGGDVVLKFPHRRVLDNPVLANRWRRELALTERLQHPLLQCRLDIAERHAEPYMVLDYASGGSLRHWLSTEKDPVPVGQVITWGRQLAAALAYLHDARVIHRDVKPENLLVTEDLTIKLADFGAATTTPGPRRWWQLPLPPEGTAEYISPEQVIGAPGDERTDIYGWGIVMYELLTGRVPFHAETDGATMVELLGATPVPIRQLRPDVGLALEAVVMTAMRRFPGHRQPDVTTLLDQLDHLDDLDLSGFDLTPEEPMRGSPGGMEVKAFARLALVVASSFVGVVALILVFAVARR